MTNINDLSEYLQGLGDGATQVDNYWKAIVKKWANEGVEAQDEINSMTAMISTLIAPTNEDEDHHLYHPEPNDPYELGRSAGAQGANSLWEEYLQEFFREEKDSDKCREIMERINLLTAIHPVLM